MSAKLHLLVRMQTKLRPLVFNNQLQLLDQVELQLWLLKMFTFNYRGAQLMVEFSLLTPLQLLTLELCNHRIVLLQVTVLNHLLTLARMLILCPVNPRRNCPNWRCQNFEAKWHSGKILGTVEGESHIRSNEDWSKLQFSYRDIPKSFGKPLNIISKQIPGCVNDGRTFPRVTSDGWRVAGDG